MKNAMCIDDDPITLKICRKVLISVEFCENVTTCLSADEALNELKSSCGKKECLPEIIFLDINMPVKDGWQFLREYQEQCKGYSIPVVILSSSIDPLDVEKSEKFRQVIYFIHKPLTAEKIRHLSEKLRMNTLS